ncbi:MAG: SAM-dependent methyltransferase [Paracoccaceae bacterium]
MTHPPNLTDAVALARNRARARAMKSPAMFLQASALAEIQERLKLVNRTFTAPAIVTPFADQWRGALPGATIVNDDETLRLTPGAHDLVVHALSMHWANDPVGQMVQARRALRADGLFLAVLFGGQTLHELRSVLAEAEIAQTGGLSPRILPMAEIRDLGSLLQRAGFALPVADTTTTSVNYASALHLMRDLRAMGEANALAARNRTPLRRAVLEHANRLYYDSFGDDGRICATFEMIFLAGWAPAENQPKPLRPGSATHGLADALGVKEWPLLEPDTDHQV